MIFLFVGERRSPLAKKMKVYWRDGALAAKQLFDALRECGIDPEKQLFTNLFEPGGKTAIRSAQATGIPIVAMGQKVQRTLGKIDIAYIPIVHPAARGRIRKKELYARHVREMLAMT